MAVARKLLIICSSLAVIGIFFSKVSGNNLSDRIELPKQTITMSTLEIKKVASIVNADNVSDSFDKEGVVYNTLTQINWKDYPYKPDVKFRIAHDGNNIYMNWKVDEQEIKAVCEVDGGNVWEDSCVEFFVAFDSSNYYNIETNCIGKVLVQSGKGRDSREMLPLDVIGKIQRWASLGDKAIATGAGSWELSLIIPKELFIKGEVKSLDNIPAKANFYKCGDELKVPHFITWNPIETETPNYHVPQFFGGVHFE